MKKHIIHFGEDPDQKGIYNLIVKSIDIPNENELEKLVNNLKQNGFDIHLAEGRHLEAIFSNNNYMCWETYGELVKEGLEYKDQTRITINVPGYERILPSE